jgi:ADP-ribose pyrophosphatase YjhB (NUDIX family)
MITCLFENNDSGSLRHVVADNLVLAGDKILLVKRTNKLLEGGKWGLVGGFVERDETIRQAAAREIMEEVGYTVKDITLLRIIDSPNRPAEDRQNVAFVHFCTVVGPKAQSGDEESTDQRWFPLSALPEESEIAFDHFSSIALYMAYRSQSFNLPIFG